MEKSKQFIQKHKGFWQFVKYALLSGVASVVEFAVFALLNFFVFASLKNTDFVWWILDYNATTGGGLGGFFAVVISYICAQVFNFFVQRKNTFHSTTDPVKSGIQYAIMVIAVWFFQAFFAGFMMKLLSAPLGEELGESLAYILCMTMSFAIQFPINKFVIMRGDKHPAKEAPANEVKG